METSPQPFALLKETVKEWFKDKAATKSAALAFYTIFSLAPLMIIVIAVASIFFGEFSARQELHTQIEQLIGSESANVISHILDQTQKTKPSWFAAFIGFLTLLFGASAVFGQLHDSLNSIWKISIPPEHNLLKFIRIRFLAFTMVLLIGFLLLLSLLISTALSAMHYYFKEYGTDTLWQLINLGVSFALITLLFAMIFKILPDVVIRWSDVWLGAAISSFLFTAGKFFIGLYLGHSTTISAYGAAGSLVVILFWIYFSAQILFLGAEFTKVLTQQSGRPLLPKNF